MSPLEARAYTHRGSLDKQTLAQLLLKTAREHACPKEELMSHKPKRARYAQADEEVRRIVYSILDQIVGTQRSRFKVSVGKGVVSVRGEVPSTLDFGVLADSLHAIPQVKHVNARVKVMCS